MSKGFLLDKEMLEILTNLDESSVKNVVELLGNLKTGERVITKALFSKNYEKIRNVVVDGKSRMVMEKFFINMGYTRTEIEQEDYTLREEDKKENGSVKILSAPNIAPKKVVVKDFVGYFRARYEFMKKVLEERDLDNLTSIRKLSSKRGNYTVIAAVLSKRVTKNKNILLEVEDLTGSVVVLINQNKKEVFELAKEILVDDILAFDVTGSSEMLFANNIYFPDTALTEKKKFGEDEWVAFCSDFHIGSKMFLEKNLLKFIKWLNGEEGDEKQREIAKKVKYLLVTGDSIDGVGVFPDQDKVLNLKDIRQQYAKLASLLKLVRNDVKIILSPGQHDGVRVAEPQPIVDEDWAPDLMKIDNLILVTNPAMIEIDGGFRILMYHGASFHGIINEIEELRLKYGHDSPTQVVKHLLKRRHLAPMHGLTTYIPNEKEDYMAITQVPDIVATGDLHRPDISSYNNILLIASSCWQSITPFEEKVGNHPDPCKVPLFNLKSREIKIMDFSDEDSSKTFEERLEEDIAEKHKEEAEKLKQEIEKKVGVENENS